MKRIEKEYDIVNAQMDSFATVWATSAKAALEIWRTQLWTRNPHARTLAAIATGNKREVK